MDRNKLLKQTEKDLDNFMKVYPVILPLNGNAVRKIKQELESRYNHQVRALEREQADKAKAAEQEAIKTLQEAASKKATDESPAARLERLEKALAAMGMEV